MIYKGKRMRDKRVSIIDGREKEKNNDKIPNDGLDKRDKDKIVK
jgi:hypothetical protein